MKPGLNCLFSGIAFVAASSVARAQDAATYPSKPVQVIIPWAPGGIVDNVGRAVVRAMGSTLGLIPLQGLPHMSSIMFPDRHFTMLARETQTYDEPSVIR